MNKEYHILFTFIKLANIKMIVKDTLMSRTMVVKVLETKIFKKKIGQINIKVN